MYWWNRGFESHSRHGCLCLCCPVWRERPCGGLIPGPRPKSLIRESRRRGMPDFIETMKYAGGLRRRFPRSALDSCLRCKGGRKGWENQAAHINASKVKWCMEHNSRYWSRRLFITKLQKAMLLLNLLPHNNSCCRSGITPPFHVSLYPRW
jgi:hypothetical protein